MPLLKSKKTVKNSSSKKIIKSKMKTKKTTKMAAKTAPKPTQIIRRVNFGDFTTNDDDDVTLAYSTVSEIHADRDYAQFDVFATDDDDVVRGDSTAEHEDDIENIITDYAGLDVPVEAS